MRVNRALFLILALITAAGILLVDRRVSAAAPQPTTDGLALKSLAALHPVDVHAGWFHNAGSGLLPFTGDRQRTDGMRG